MVKFEEALVQMREYRKAFRSQYWGANDKIWVDDDGDLTTSFIGNLSLDFDDIVGLWEEVELSEYERVGHE